MPTILEDAWNAAEPKLRQIGTTTSEAVSRFSRVTPLDADLLDYELSQVLLEPMHRALALINTTISIRFEAEIRLLVQLVMYKLSIWNTGASYGAKLQNLEYITPHTTKSTVLAPSGLPQNTLFRHASLTIILPYLHGRLRSYATSHSWPDAPSSDRRRKIWRLLNILESLFEVLSLINFITFIRGGRYRSLIDRFLKMNLMPSRANGKRDISYEFMNRQMVWHAFTEFLLFFLPLINRRAVRRITSHGFFVVFETIRLSLPASILGGLSHFKDSSSRTMGLYRNLPSDQCAICIENSGPKVDSEPTYVSGSNLQPDLPPDSLEVPISYPIHNPYMGSCGHIYCYQCIAERLLQAADEAEDMPWQCLRCGESVREAHRYQMGVHDKEFSESEYEFSSDFELSTDVSGSLYSESIHS